MEFNLLIFRQKKIKKRRIIWQKNHTFITSIHEAIIFNFLPNEYFFKSP
jgi:hypothetical protein